MPEKKSRTLVVLALLCGAAVPFLSPAQSAPAKNARNAAKPAAKTAPAKAAPAKAPAEAPAKSEQLLAEDTCLKVIEGDLIEAKKVGQVRLIGIMAPSEGEPGYQEALGATRKLVEGKPIKVEICPVRPNDKKDRVRGVVYLADGTNLSTRLLRAGRVRLLDKKPCHIDTAAWKSYEDSARAKHRGLWAKAAATDDGAAKPKRSASDEGAEKPKHRSHKRHAEAPRVRIRPQN